MNNLILSQNDSQEEFIRKLNQATNYVERLKFPTIKFNAKEGVWYRDTSEKDAEGKPVFENLGKAINFHLITTRKMVQTNMEAAEQLYSREFQDNYVVLYNQSKQEVMRGFYNVLKLANPDLQFIQVLYVYYGDKPYKIKIGGIKLSKWFSYFGSFKNDSPSRYLTIAEQGQIIKTKLTNGREVSNYELNFQRGEVISDYQLIISRVNGINEYLNMFNKPQSNAVNNEEPPMIAGPEMPDFADGCLNDGLTDEQKAEIN